jgi:type VI secretion system secreted protein Hcp
MPALATVPGARGLGDYFLKLDGIEGESLDSKHKGEIQLDSYSFSVTQSVAYDHSGGGLAAGKSALHDLKIIKRTDKATAKLFAYCASGQHVPKATLIARRAGKDQQEYLKIVFTDLLVSKVDIAAHAKESHIPMDDVSFNYSKIEIEYKEQKPDGSLGGSVKAGYDVKENKVI